MKLVCTLLLLSAFSLSAATVFNPGFEDPNISPNYYVAVNAGSSSLTGWNVTGTSIDIVNGAIWAHSGSQGIDLAGTPGPGGVNQNITTVAGQSYLISFWVSSNGGAISNRLTVNFDGTAHTYSSPAQRDWTQYSFTAVASSNLANLSFSTPLTGNAGPLLDDVSVSSAVPEPATISLVAAGMLLAFARLRRR